MCSIRMARYNAVVIEVKANELRSLQSVHGLLLACDKITCQYTSLLPVVSLSFYLNLNS